MFQRAVPTIAADFIRREEQLRLTAYPDIGGVPTIAYGHTGKDVHLGAVISPAEAEYLLQGDLSNAALAVLRLVKVPLDDYQFSALISFVFNLGAGALASSTLLRLLNAGQVEAAAAQFERWDHAAGHEVEALKARRLAEAALFLTNLKKDPT